MHRVPGRLALLTGRRHDDPAEALPGSSPVLAVLTSVGPLHVVLATVVVALTMITSRSVNDIDSYWHVEIGREILRTRRVSGLGSQWLGVPAPDWRTSQWLSEVAMTSGVAAWGWRALVVGRLVLLAALVVVLAVTLLPGRPVRLATPVVVLLLVSLAAAVQDRPQTISLVFVALLAAACVRLWTTDRRPPYLAIGAGCLLWAQIHGLWIIAPAAFAVVAVGRRLDHRPVRPALGACAASLVGVVNPWGPASFVLPLRLRAAATGIIGEWAPTTLTEPFTIAWAAMIAVLVLAWVRSPSPVPRTELLWGLAWSTFGALAYRNVAMSALLLAPAVLMAVDRAWGDAARRRSTSSGRREGTLLALLAVGMLVGGFGTAAAQAWRADPLANTQPLRIAQRLAGSAEPVRVFNAYNASGVLVAFGGGKVRLVVDGRADLWGAATLDRLGDAQRLAPGWQDVLARFDPDVLVLAEDSPLAQVLVREGRWRVDLRDQEYVLLRPAP